jgi:uncharacterized surface protein with fasciclin (FAS1) repeats
MTDFASLLRRGRFVGVGLLVFTLVLTGCDAFTDQDLGDSNPQPPTIAEYIQEVRVFSSLEAAVAEADLTSTLNDESSTLTIFAPTDDAFSPPIDPSLNQQVLTKVLQHHTVNGEVTSGDLNDGDTETPLAGDNLAIGVSDGVISTVNRASVTNADAEASNGVVHVVDNLLIDAVDRATLTPRFTIFARLVKEAGLEGALRAPGSNDGRTIFAPTNEALLAALDDDGDGSVENGEMPSNAGAILRHHVLNSVFLAGDVPTSETAVSTLEGTDVTVSRDAEDGTVSVGSGSESATVEAADVVVDNGVIHGIDTVLLP